MIPLMIYCDASVAQHNGGRAGWGAVMVLGDFYAEASGEVLRYKGQGTALVELQAATKALQRARDMGLLARASEVVIASDCEAVGTYLLEVSVKRPIRNYVLEAARVRAILSPFGLRVTVCKVKAHNSHNASTDPHAVHNSRADKLARIAAGVRQS